jgi:hypothetical protein
MGPPTTQAAAHRSDLLSVYHPCPDAADKGTHPPTSHRHERLDNNGPVWTKATLRKGAQHTDGANHVIISFPLVGNELDLIRWLFVVFGESQLAVRDLAD